MALLVGLAAGAFCASSVERSTGVVPSDFEFWWRGARLWLAGSDPWAGRPGTPGWPLPDPLFYPMPALLLTIPVAGLPIAWAAGIATGASSALLAWALTRTGWWRLLVLASPSFIMAVKIGQWAPLLTAAAVLPGAGFALAAKPTLGIAHLAYRVSPRAVVGMALIMLASLAVRPTWPAEWLANLTHVVSHPAPIATPLGVLTALALLRWRQPEARLLLAMACVPQLLFFVDQLVLGLVARSRQELAALDLCGAVAFLAWWVSLSPGDRYVLHAAPFVLVGLYLPALTLVLRRPNAGELPEAVLWLQRRAAQRRGAAPGP